MEPFEFGLNRERQSLGESRLARAGVVLQKNMTAADQGHQQFADGARLPRITFSKKAVTLPKISAGGRPLRISILPSDKDEPYPKFNTGRDASATA